MDPLVRSTARQVQMIAMQPLAWMFVQPLPMVSSCDFIVRRCRIFRSTTDVGLSAAAGSRDNPIRATARFPATPDRMITCKCKTLSLDC